MNFDQSEYFKAIDQTWPAAKYIENDNWLFREGRGGGKRVSAASALNANASVEVALKQFNDFNKRPLFMLKDGDRAIDEALAKLDFAIIDPVDVMAIGVDNSDDDIEKFCHDAPTKIAKEIWAEGGIEKPRLDVMARAKCAKTYLQIDNGAVAFAAIWNEIAMVHALEVQRSARRQGMGKRMMQIALTWAEGQGARELVVLTVKANKPAQQLYRNMGFRDVAHYHYRQAP